MSKVKTRSHTPPPLSRVYIRTKKIPYLYIYIMYILFPGGGCPKTTNEQRYNI